MTIPEGEEFGIDWNAEAERSAAIVKCGYTDASFFDYFKDLIKDNTIVLELGCNIANWYPTWRIMASNLHINLTYVGMDFSPRAIEIARERYRDASFLYQNIKDLRFDNQVDVVFTHTCLQHVSIETKRIIAPKIWKALKPDGLLIIQENTATISDGTWANTKGWIDFFEGYGFKNIRNHNIGDGGTGMIFRKVDTGEK